MRKREMKKLSGLLRNRCPVCSGQGVRIKQDKVSG
jgi:Ribonuclease G/E